MATITRGGDHFESSRYKYDMGLCAASKGWAQLDTKQDASYYGNWVNPITRELFSYCEGDITHTQCDDDADFIATLAECIAWHKERDYFLGIDPGWPGSGPCALITAAFERLGLAEHLH